MANALFAKFKQKLLEKNIDLVNDTIKCGLILNTYSPNLSTHEFKTSIDAYIIGTPQTLGSKTVTLGVFDAADPTFTAVAGGSTLSGLAVWMDNGGVSATSPLILFDDTITGFPLATNGGDITPQWDNGASKIFAL